MRAIEMIYDPISVILNKLLRSNRHWRSKSAVVFRHLWSIPSKSRCLMIAVRVVSYAPDLAIQGNVIQKNSDPIVVRKTL